MRHIILAFALAGCASAYDEGWDEGCFQGSLDGAMWGGADAALCYDALPDAGTVRSGPSRFDDGYADGYTACFPDAYLDAWNFMLDSLEADLGACDALL